MTLSLDVGPSTDDLVAVLDPAIRSRLGTSIDGLSRSPSRYSTSFAIETLELALSDSSHLTLIFKNLSSEALLDDARRTRPEFVYDPQREVDVYRRLLSTADLGTARLYAAEAEASAGRYWLFLEKVPGVELYQVEDLEVWKAAARWLRTMHHTLSAADAPASVTRYDAEWYRLWMKRAASFTGEESAAAVERLASIHEAVVEHLCALPATVTHGDFFASNVLTGRTESGLRVCPVDWERTAVAPGLFDLAGLCAGWDDRTSAELARAYAGRESVDFISLAFCRLQLCIQWLGWSPRWTPPADHRRDWLDDALRLAVHLGL